MSARNCDVVQGVQKAIEHCGVEVSRTCHGESNKQRWKSSTKILMKALGVAGRCFPCTLCMLRELNDLTRCNPEREACLTSICSSRSQSIVNKVPTRPKHLRINQLLGASTGGLSHLSLPEHGRTWARTPGNEANPAQHINRSIIISGDAWLSYYGLGLFFAVFDLVPACRLVSRPAGGPCLCSRGPVATYERVPWHSQPEVILEIGVSTVGPTAWKASKYFEFA